MENQYEKQLQRVLEYVIQNDGGEFQPYIKQTVKRIKETKNLCLFGHGYYYELIAKVVVRGVADYNLISDNNKEKQGKEFDGVICVPPEKLTEYEDLVVLITTLEWSGIKQQLDQMGIENYPVVEVFPFISDEFYDADWFLQNKDSICKGLDLFEDDWSKEIYVNAIASRIAPQFVTKSFKELYTTGEYFKQDVYPLTTEEYFVDGGAFDGDTIMEFLINTKLRFGKLYAFEMEKDNFRLLEECVKHMRIDEGAIELYPYGLWDENKTISYMDNWHSSKMGEGSKETNAVRMDDALKGKKVTMIKMDIEGAEIHALQGASGIIKEQAPKLAICVYHSLSHFWEIPQMIKKMNPEYKLFLRHHSLVAWETACYAYIPLS